LVGPPLGGLFLTVSQKVRYRRYASALVIAAYHKHASFLEPSDAVSRTFSETVGNMTFYESIFNGTDLTKICAPGGVLQRRLIPHPLSRISVRPSAAGFSINLKDGAT
jgi:hypothetical protein